jgi:hypothetical protein
LNNTLLRAAHQRNREILFIVLQYKTKYLTAAMTKKFEFYYGGFLFNQLNFR